MTSGILQELSVMKMRVQDAEELGGLQKIEKLLLLIAKRHLEKRK